MKTVDLFAGCGGMSKGFQNCGFDIIAAFEHWNVAAECYRENFDHIVYETDLSDVDEAVRIIQTFKPELIIGGPPCQDFSFAGKRIEAGRASLTGSFAEIVTAIRPPYFVMENVDRARQSNAFAYAKSTFVESGYGLTEVVLDASHCGVPQKRKRFFCIGVYNAADNCVLPFIERAISEKAMTLRDYFGETLDFEYYYRHPRNYSRRAIFSIDEPAPTMRGVNRPVPKGYPGHANDARILDDSIRSLTTLERALIQTFPADFRWIGSKTDMEQMIGNAVPVKLAEFVGKSLLAYIESKTLVSSNKDEFVTWLVNSMQYSQRSASDVVSRLNRVYALCPTRNITDPYYMYELEKKPLFSTLTASVRSQIKRAVSLYTAFLQHTSGELV